MSGVFLNSLISSSVYSFCEEAALSGVWLLSFSTTESCIRVFTVEIFCAASVSYTHLDVYKRQDKQGILKSVDGTKPMDEVFSAIVGILGE